MHKKVHAHFSLTGQTFIENDVDIMFNDKTDAMFLKIWIDTLP